MALRVAVAELEAAQAALHGKKGHAETIIQQQLYAAKRVTEDQKAVVARMQASQEEAEERHRVELRSLQTSAAAELRSSRQSLETDKAAALERLHAETEEAEEQATAQVRAAAEAAAAELRAAKRVVEEERAARHEQLSTFQAEENTLRSQLEQATAAAAAAESSRRSSRRQTHGDGLLTLLELQREKERAEQEFGLKAAAGQREAEERAGRLAAEEERGAALQSLAASAQREEGEAAARVLVEAHAQARDATLHRTLHSTGHCLAPIVYSIAHCTVQHVAQGTVHHSNALARRLSKASCAMRATV